MPPPTALTQQRLQHDTEREIQVNQGSQDTTCQLSFLLQNLRKHSFKHGQYKKSPLFALLSPIKWRESSKICYVYMDSPLGSPSLTQAAVKGDSPPAIPHCCLKHVWVLSQVCFLKALSFMC